MLELGNTQLFQICLLNKFVFDHFTNPFITTFPLTMKLSRVRGFIAKCVFLCNLFCINAASVRPSASGANSLNQFQTREVVDLDDFIILQKPVTWTRAMAACFNYDRHLAVLPTIADAELLVEKLRDLSQPHQKHSKRQRYWIGLTDIIIEGKWQWLDTNSKLQYDFWAKGRPYQTPEGNPKHCASIMDPSYKPGDHHHHFIDEDCSSKYFAVCGKKVEARVRKGKVPSSSFQ